VKDLFSVGRLIREDIARLKPYTPILPFEVLSRQLGRSPVDITKLDANENPYGPAPTVKDTLAQAAYLHIYPDPESRELRAALAEYTGVNSDLLLVGHGADELIDLILRLFIAPGDTIVNCPPTFGMYAFDAGVNGARVIDTWRDEKFAVQPEQITSLFSGNNNQPPPKIIFVTSPNNPDGSLLPDAELEALLALPAMIVLDEAYVEFSGNSRITWTERYENLIVLRTFSKWAGIAGLRVGYGAFPAAIIEQLWKIKQPYNVSVAGQLAALASLKDREYLLKNVTRIVAQRDRLYEILKNISWLQPYPSQANFVLCRVIERSAADTRQKLAEQGILVRYYDSPGLNDHLRISVGTAAQLTHLENGLKQL
jgi:histidinol-phosphate aminotransferase